MKTLVGLSLALLAAPAPPGREVHPTPSNMLGRWVWTYDSSNTSYLVDVLPDGRCFFTGVRPHSYRTVASWDVRREEGRVYFCYREYQLPTAGGYEPTLWKHPLVRTRQGWYCPAHQFHLRRK